MATRPKARRSVWYWLLAVPFLALAFPALYAREHPALAGLPFFYWYQFALLFVASFVTWVVYVRTRR